MDIRLAIPALGLWLGAGFTFFVTGLNAEVIERNDRSRIIISIGLVLLVICLFFIVNSKKKPLHRVTFVGVAAFAGGLIMCAMHVTAQTSQPLATWISTESAVTIQGVITTEPQKSATAATAVWKTPVVQRFTLASTFINGENVEVPISIEVAPDFELPPVGTGVVVTGKLGESYRYGNFAAALTGVEQILIVSPPGVIDAIANSMRAGLRESLHGIEPGAGALVAGLAIGDESGLPGDLENAMRLSGLAHLTAVSGGNVAIVLALVIGMSAALRVQLKGRVVIALAALGFYVVLVQAQPSVLRAAVMGAILVLALLVGGRRAGPSVLSMAVILLLLFDPSLSIAWGFALSVSATAGIIVITPLLLDWAQGTRVVQRVPPLIISAGALTISAQVATVPVMIVMGVPMGLGSVPANILAMPMVPFITVGGLLSAVLSPLSLPMGHAFALLSSWPAAWIAALAGFFGQWPTVTGLQFIAAAIVGGGIIFVAKVMRRKELLLIAPVMLLVFIGFRLVTSNSWIPESWFMVVCDVGQGDAIVLRDATGSVIVVDVGPDPDLVDQCLRDLDVNEIEAIIISHFHRDHVGGIAGVFRGRDVNALYVTPHWEPADQYEYSESVIPQSLPRDNLGAGQIWTMAEGRLDVLWPDRILQQGSVPNNASVVFIFETRGYQILLTGDIEREAQQSIMRSNPRVGADIVKVPHHGSANLDPDFADWAGGRITLFSVGAGNDYGHPSIESLSEWSHTQQFRTDLHGSIALFLDDSGDLAVSSEN